jgi:uncharacterized protein
VSDSSATNSTPISTAKPIAAAPDYVGLVRFLVEPFLESPDSLRIDCETLPSRARVLIRLAFEGEDKGRVFGRGGRNIQAIRTVLQAIAESSGQTVHLDIFGGMPNPHEGNHEERSHSSGRPPRRPPRTRPR